ncbi:MAG: RHS repeat-associated core domain-containing protein, partial [Flavobacteriaceae bacterium]|nr:RHS repeat-associated core domain-containing protein [Flavobacteriaceae bacterium]
MPFGEMLMEQTSGDYDNVYKYNGKELDESTGLYYYGARYYDPRTSIWLSVDPLAIYNPVAETEFYGDGQHNGGVFYSGNLNAYIYTYQNPIRYIDPNGKQTEFWKGFYETLFPMDRQSTLDTGRWHSSGPEGSSKSYSELADERDAKIKERNSNSEEYKSGETFADIVLIVASLLTPGPADDAYTAGKIVQKTAKKASELPVISQSLKTLPHAVPREKFFGKEQAKNKTRKNFPQFFHDF